MSDYKIVNIGKGNNQGKYFGGSKKYKRSSNSIDSKKWKCPTLVTKPGGGGAGWEGGETYPDKFSVKQHNDRVYAHRTDSYNNGWGMNLRFKCHKAPVTNPNAELENKNKELSDKLTLLQGQLINTNNRAKIVASDRFGELKSQYLKKIELVDTQEELLNKQNQNIRDYEGLITKNKKNFEGDRASASTYARKILYNKKDLNFYNISLNILKFILLFISIAIIYLLMKGNKLKRMSV